MAQDDTGRETVYQICTQGVAGSNPAVSTKIADSRTGRRLFFMRDSNP